jgi:oxygen-dependent protoporphyrinogen oxidase
VEIRSVGAERLSRRDGGGWSVETSDGGAIATDGVVVAAPAAVASRLVAAVDSPLAAELAGIEYAGSAVVSLGFAREDIAHPLDAAGVVVPRAEGRRILAVSFSSSKFPGRAPEGMVLMRSFVGGALDPAAARLADCELESIVMDDLRSLLGVRGSPRLVQIDRWAGAMPQYHLGHLDRLARIDARLAGLSGLALAGAAYRGVGIPQVILSGRMAALRL